METSALNEAERSCLSIHLSKAISPNRIFRYLREQRLSKLQDQQKKSGTQPISELFIEVFNDSFWIDLFAGHEKEWARRGFLRRGHTYEGHASLQIRAEKEIATCIQKKINIVTYASPAYPKILKTIDMPPLVLYYKGCLPSFHYERDYAVAIVGTRRSEIFINEFVETLATAIVSHGGHIISGMALGVDQAAHRGALSAGPHASNILNELQKIPLHSTTAVLASSVDHIYPYTNRSLYYKIIEQGGCILSEYGPDILPMRYHFPIRNRIIAGLAQCVFMAQASIKSGALITAQYALDYGRHLYTYDVETVNPLPQAYAGNLRLIEEGAYAIKSVEHFIEHIGLARAQNSSQTPNSPYTAPASFNHSPITTPLESASSDPPHAPNAVGGTEPSDELLEKNILFLLKTFPASLQELAQKLNVETIALTPILMELMLSDAIREISPNRYSLKR